MIHPSIAIERLDERAARCGRRIMTMAFQSKSTQSIAPRKPVLGGATDEAPKGSVAVKVVPSRVEEGDGFEVIGEGLVGKLDADGILTIKLDTRARLGRTGKGLGPNLTIASTGGAIALGMSGRLTLSAYQIAGLPDERPKGERR
jgi:hypothetical protein